MISQTAEYALRAIVALGMDVDRPMTTRDMAVRTKVPPGYLSKVLQSLRRSGLVKAQRGLGGGFVLARPLDQMTVLEVINAVDPVRRITHCPLGLAAHRDGLCSLHQRLDAGVSLMEGLFASSSIQDLVTETGVKRPLCDDEAEASVPGRSR